MSDTFDHALRDLERSYRSDPDNQHVARAFLAALRRAGRTDLVARVRFRLGERVEACAEVGIRWEVDPSAIRAQSTDLQWRGKPVSLEQIAEAVSLDLLNFDPQRLVDSWAKRKSDGGLQLNRTVFLKRYPAHERNQVHRRLILLAWTPGTSTTYERPEDQGLQKITVGLETRATQKRLLDPAAWQSP